MKKILGVVIILAILILAAFYGMGIVTEKIVKRDLETLNKSPRAKVKLVNYERGFFSSTALIDWSIQIPEQMMKSASGQPEIVPAQTYEIRMPLNISHGPIIVADRSVKFGMGYAKTEIPLPEKYREQFKKQFTTDSVQPKLDLSIFVTYLGNSNLNLAVPAFKLIEKEGGEFNWLGLNSTFNVSSDAKKIKGDLSLDGISLSKDLINAKMDKMRLDYDVHKGDSGLYLGDANLSLAAIVIDKKREQGFEKLFELSNLDLQSASNGKDGLFESKLTIKVDKLIVQEKQYGPAELKTSIKNLDAAVMAHINSALNQAKHDDEMENQKILLAILPEIPKLLAHAAEFEISELSFVMPEGKIEGNLLLKLPKGDNANPFELLYKMQGKGRLKVPAAVVNAALTEFNRQRIMAHLVPAPTVPAGTTAVPASTPTATDPTKLSQEPSSQPALNAPADPNADLSKQTESLTKTQLDSMLQSGLIVQEGNDYVIEAVFNDGKLVVNGKPFNSAMLRF